jgi:hypothetical protein
MPHRFGQLTNPVVLLAASIVAASAFAAADAGYRTVQSVPANDGRVQVLEDARLTPSLAKKLWGTSTDPLLVLGEDDPTARSFKIKPLLPAKLRQIGSRGEVVADTVFANPLARIETRKLGLASAAYLVTTDDSVGMGSYSGLVTQLYAIQHRRLRPMLATDAAGKTQPITLVDTLKSGWKITDANPTHTVIEQLLCRPDFKTAQDFTLTFITYWFDGHVWRTAHRSAPGFWEDDQDWPAVASFPQPRTG